VGLRDGEHRGVAAVDEGGERLLVTGAQALEEIGFVLHAGVRHVATLSASRRVTQANVAISRRRRR